MSPSDLHPCPSCARHVRASEASCPFCESALPSIRRASVRNVVPRERLHRLAIVTTAATLAGCFETATSTPFYGQPCDPCNVIDGSVLFPTADAAPPDAAPADAADAEPREDDGSAADADVIDGG